MDRQILTGVFERCSAIADRAKSQSVLEPFKKVEAGAEREEKERHAKKTGGKNGFEHSGGGRAVKTVSELLMTWIAMEVRAAAACVKEVGQALSVGRSTSDRQPLHRKVKRREEG